MSKITIESTIDRRYLRNRTKDEIIEHVMRLLAENDALTAELAAKDKALDQAWDWVAPVVPGLSRNYPELAAELRKREGQ